jgi:hypothetical protein
MMPPLPKALTNEVQAVFANLPPNFFGHIEFHFKNGVPGFAKVTATTMFSDPSGKNPGQTHENSVRQQR